MAAYAALVSVMQIIHQIKNHPFPPISLDKQQVDSLTEKVNLLQEFLEGYDSPFCYSDEADSLEMRIADAAYAAENVIESYIVGNIKLVAGTTHHHSDDDVAADTDADVEEISCIVFYEDVQKVIEEMDLLVKEVTEMVGEKPAVLRSVVSRNADAFGSISSVRKIEMVGFDDMLLELLDRLTGGRSNRQIIPIVGMGGVGKTTLALNVFENQLIKESFDICVWATISQNYDIQQTLAQVLSQVRGKPVNKSEPELGEELYKFFCGRKYFIVMDDMWSLDVWEEMKFFFPEYNNGSRVLVTTRLSNMATNLTNSNSLLYVKSLDEISSWSLFSETVFWEESFPIELEEIGKKIVNKCNGHPLAIIVIGGLLSKSQHTQEHWKDIEANLTSRVNSENDEYCLRILRMSYNHLPMCLKPCFLYMGVFEEDREIHVSTLMKLWVSEGFVKPRNNKSLETIGEEYLKELVDRNLVLVAKLGSLGNIKYCKMHDLLRDVCLKESRKQRFYCCDFDDTVIRMSSSRAKPFSSSLIRSILFHGKVEFKLDPADSRLLRTLCAFAKKAYYPSFSIEDVLQHVNLRYIAVGVEYSSNLKIPCSINLLWNLQTFIPVPTYATAPTEIWKMHQLRHLGSKKSEWYLPDPPRGDNDIVVMENLQTLEGVMNFNLNEEVVKRIPNIKKLSLVYDEEQIETSNCLNYLQYLSKLESFLCRIRYGGGVKILQNVSFPKSLKKLVLDSDSDFEWEDILPKIGAIPLLQKLSLGKGIFRTRKWETIEGQFPSLKVLHLFQCWRLEKWMVSESSHFPRLQELRLSYLKHLEEIPSEIGEIATLNSILLNNCSKSAVVSAKKIIEDQEELQGEQLDLHVRVKFGWFNREQIQDLQHLASPNFHLINPDLSFDD